MLHKIAAPIDVGHRFPRALAGATVVFGAVFAASLFGIVTRPIDSLAAIWPANALLLGMMVRNRTLASPFGWCAALAGYIAADLATGGGLVITLWLSVANVSGVITGYLLFSRGSDTVRKLRGTTSVLHMYAICALSAFVASLTGAGAAGIVFDRDFLSGLPFWFITELVNYIIVLPTILTLPPLAFWSRQSVATRWAAINGRHMLPALSLLGSIVIAFTIGGPGAITFTVPTLVWCALTYSVFTTALLTTLSSSALLIGISANYVALPLPPDAMDAAISMRLGFSLMALGPLTIASISGARLELIRQLAHAVNHDTLTEALSRRAFFEQAGAATRGDRHGPGDVSVIMIDLDHFKQINDRHGHHGGDEVLKGVARIVSARLRTGDVFGRLGGEEFALVLPATSMGEALAIAEMLRREIANATIEIDFDGGVSSTPVTASMGVTAAATSSTLSIDGLLADADRALYEAKARGRNRVVAYSGDASSHSLPRAGGMATDLDAPAMQQVGHRRAKFRDTRA